MSARVRIGTSGWHYPHWKGRFYPAGLRPAEQLAHYARTFDTVEVNNSFYKLPTAAAVTTWRASVPAAFTFAVKASRYLTHMKKLADPAEPLARFLPVVEGLGPQLGPILFQLPPRWRANPGRLAALLALLPARHRYAFELRDPSWWTPAIEALLAAHGVAQCVHDIEGEVSPLVVTARFVYVRLHGPGEKYRGRYGADAIAAWAGRVRAWRARGLDAYVYFDNDEAGYAALDARELLAAVG